MLSLRTFVLVCYRSTLRTSFLPNGKKYRPKRLYVLFFNTILLKMYLYKRPDVPQRSAPRSMGAGVGGRGGRAQEGERSKGGKSSYTKIFLIRNLTFVKSCTQKYL